MTKLRETIERHRERVLHLSEVAESDAYCDAAVANAERLLYMAARDVARQAVRWAWARGFPSNQETRRRDEKLLEEELAE